MTDYKYTFRAETLYDVGLFINKYCPKMNKITITPYIDMTFPDMKVELETKMPLEELRQLLKKVDDGHVMYQSLNYSDGFTGERNYNL